MHEQKVNRSRVEQVLTEMLSLREPRFRLESAGGRVSGSIVSSSFKGKPDSQRQKMIWDALEQTFGPRALKVVGMLLAYTPDEWQAGQEAAAVGATVKVKSR